MPRHARTPRVGPMEGTTAVLWAATKAGGARAEGKWQRLLVKNGRRHPLPRGYAHRSTFALSHSLPGRRAGTDTFGRAHISHFPWWRQGFCGLPYTAFFHSSSLWRIRAANHCAHPLLCLTRRSFLCVEAHHPLAFFSLLFSLTGKTTHALSCVRMSCPSCRVLFFFPPLFIQKTLTKQNYGKS